VPWRIAVESVLMRMIRHYRRSLTCHRRRAHYSTLHLQRGRRIHHCCHCHHHHYNWDRRKIVRLLHRISRS
jgi:hypothetical protein